jgi:hypothetical protein
MTAMLLSAQGLTLSVKPVGLNQPQDAAEGARVDHTSRAIADSSQRLGGLLRFRNRLVLSLVRMQESSGS